MRMDGRLRVGAGEKTQLKTGVSGREVNSLGEEVKGGQGRTSDRVEM